MIRVDFDEIIPDTQDPPDDTEIEKIPPETSGDKCSKENVPAKKLKVSPDMFESYEIIIDQNIQQSPDIFTPDGCGGNDGEKNEHEQFARNEVTENASDAASGMVAAVVVEYEKSVKSEINSDLMACEIAEDNMLTSHPNDVPNNHFDYTLDGGSEQIDIMEIVNALMSQENVSIETLTADELIEVNRNVQSRIDRMIDELKTAS